jgi:hypothetical protein
MDDAWDDAPAPTSRGRSVLSIVRDYPEEVADWLEEQGINADDLMYEAWQRRA